MQMILKLMWRLWSASRRRESQIGQVFFFSCFDGLAGLAGLALLSHELVTSMRWTSRVPSHGMEGNDKCRCRCLLQHFLDELCSSYFTPGSFSQREVFESWIAFACCNGFLKIRMNFAYSKMIALSKSWLDIRTFWHIVRWSSGLHWQSLWGPPLIAWLYKWRHNVKHSHHSHHHSHEFAGACFVLLMQELKVAKDAARELTKMLKLWAKNCVNFDHMCILEVPSSQLRSLCYTSWYFYILLILDVFWLHWSKLDCSFSQTANRKPNLMVFFHTFGKHLTPDHCIAALPSNAKTRQ